MEDEDSAEQLFHKASGFISITHYFYFSHCFISLNSVNGDVDSECVVSLMDLDPAMQNECSQEKSVSLASFEAHFFL
jgi:hypothetical protein